MLSITIAVLLAVMVVGLARAFTGPNVFDRILAANLFGTKTVLLIACISYLFGSPGFLDIALVYALTNYLGVVGVLRVTELRPERRKEAAE
ncbi:MAG: pH regulation protein F [Halioglobus sp.]|nr:pH regulation protein F [Halioglobus sp.]